MIDFIVDNFAAIVISALLLTALMLYLVYWIKRNKKGKALGCGCGCEGCPSEFLCGKQ